MDVYSVKEKRKTPNVAGTEKVVNTKNRPKMLKVSGRGKFAILHNFAFLSGWINLKVIF